MARDEQLETLAYAVRGRVVAKYLGQIALVLAALTAVPLGVALLDGELPMALRLLAVIAVLGAAGGLGQRLPAPAHIQVNEALVITALAFGLTPLLMSYPLMAAGLGFEDALFEAVSAVTTTGLTTLETVAERSHAFLFTRAWMQWYGGLGIVVLSLALLAGHTAAARRLLEPEQAGESLATTTRLHARRMGLVYLLLSLGGLLLLLPLAPDPFSALTHVLSGVSTGGFSSLDNSLAGMSASAALLLTLLAACGALALPLYYFTAIHGWRQVREAPELPLLAGLLLALIAALTLTFAAGGMGWGEALGQGFLLGFSAQTTTGFAALDTTALVPGIMALLLPAMAIGGSVGSTAGGIKLLRLLILWRLLRHTLRRSAMPAHAVAEPRLGGRRLEHEEIERALLLILLFVAVVLLSWLPFVLAGYPPLDALFEVVSACGTVGLSSGISHSDLPLGLKGILCFDMLAGRVEIVALLVVLFPGTWFGKRNVKQ